MSNTFMDSLKKESTHSEISFTENGAIGFKTQGSAIVDINFAVPSLRAATSDIHIINEFKKAFDENPILATKWLFYARDIRKGLGEKRIFRVLFNWLISHNKSAEKLIPYIAEYGSYKDYRYLKATPQLAKLFAEQLNKDVEAMKQGKSVSLLGKWMPRINTSCKKTVVLAKYFAHQFKQTDKEYRQMLSELNKYIDVVEVKASANKWNKIDYEKVPSKANLLYKKAFLNHDRTRYTKYIEKVSNGEAKINASVLFPHDIVAKYTESFNRGWASRSNKLLKFDATLEELWKALPNFAIENTLVVADGSGSMTSPIGRSSVTALDVANALAIYFAEHNKGEFKDKYITFSNKPQFVDFSKCNSLVEKIATANEHNEVSNTNIEAVFDLILSVAVRNNISIDNMPKAVLIISDMEFDEATGGASTKTSLFEVITKKFADANYPLPKLVFWNVNSRTNTIPMQENDKGVILVSGFSLNIAKMVMSGQTDPYEALKEILLSDRYELITIDIEKTKKHPKPEIDFEKPRRIKKILI